MKRNELEELHTGAFADIEVYRFLELSNNSLKYLEPGVFNNSRISEIRFNFNKLTTVRYGVFNGTKINALCFRNNKISHLEEECFFDMPYVYSIDLTNNRLTKFRKYRFRNNRNLSFVCLIGNPVVNEVNTTAFKDEIPVLTSFTNFSLNYVLE